MIVELNDGGIVELSYSEKVDIIKQMVKKNEFKGFTNEQIDTVFDFMLNQIDCWDALYETFKDDIREEVKSWYNN